MIEYFVTFISYINSFFKNKWIISYLTILGKKIFYNKVKLNFI